MSLTIKSLFVLVVAELIRSNGIEIANDQIENAVSTLMIIGSVIGIYWGRIRAGGVTWWGIRK